ncbi:MAG: hypothetical protein AAGB22_15030, partial [Bacteroidota bacterium]
DRGVGMKKTPTTSTRPSNAQTSNRTVASKDEQPERARHVPFNQPVTYPDLQDYVPEHYHTTQDPPRYGNNSSLEENS